MRKSLLTIGFLALGMLVLTGAGAGNPPQAQMSFADNGQKLNSAVGRGVALADLNGDGSLDAFVLNQEGNKGRCRLFFGDGRGRFSEDGPSFEFPQGMGKPAVHDFNGDGKLDVLLGRTILVNDGRGRFAPDNSRFVDADNVTLWQYQLADLNKDGRIDVFALAMAPNDMRWRAYLDDGQGHFRHNAPPIGPNIQAAAALGDVNGDGFPDAVISGWRNEEGDPCPNRLFLNDGQGRFTDSGQVFDERGRHSHGLAMGDLDKDGDLDFVIVTQDAPFARIYLNDGKGRFTAGRTLGTCKAEKVALADLNGDGTLDVCLVCIGPNEVWINDGRGGFSDSGLRLGNEWSWEVAVGDINKDNLLDLFVVNLGVDFNAPPEKQMLNRFAEIWINTGKSKRP